MEGESSQLHNGRTSTTSSLSHAAAAKEASPRPFDDDDEQGNAKDDHENDDLENKEADHSYSGNGSYGYDGRQSVCGKGLDFVQNMRYMCGSLVNNDRVQLFLVALIALNALMMGIATFDFVKDNQAAEDAFEMVDRIFLFIFTIELAMQFVYHGWRLLLDGWLVFDLVIIVISWAFAEVQIIRAFRIFRALRLITRIKVMKNLVLGKAPHVL